MASKENDSSSISSKSSKYTKAKRGKVSLSKLTRRRGKGIKEDVLFNHLGQPYGKVATEMQSYIGLLVRENAKLNTKNWTAVSDVVKDLIWESVKESYNVPDKWKTKCLESANGKWRSWKTRLFNKFIVPNQNDREKLEQPPPDSGIHPGDWKQFVDSRLSDEFKKLSDLQRERCRKNDYPHRISRKGYANFAEEIKNELKGDEDCVRAILWKKARSSKEGETNNNKTKEALEKIDAYLQEKDEGTFTSTEECNDVLSRALEKPECPGRVRAIGGGVTHGIYFRFVGGKQVKIEDSTLHELEQAKKLIEEQGGEMKSLHKLVSELVIRLGNVESKLSEKDKISEGLGSCSVKAPLHDEHDMVLVDISSISPGKAIELLEGPSERVVAYGMMITVGGLLHGVQMPEDSLCVSIDEVVDGSAILPFRVSNDIATLQSALGTHVAWPANFVVERSNQKPTPSKKKVSKKLFEAKQVQDMASLPTSLSALYFVMETSYKNDRGLRVTIPFEVFGIDIVVWLLLSEDVAPFCNLDPITGNCIVVYVWHLYQSMIDTALKDKFLYVNPFSISCVKLSKIEDRARALADRLLIATQDQLVFVPCNLGIHWILTIIHPHKDTVYLMYPLSH